MRYTQLCEGDASETANFFSLRARSYVPPLLKVIRGASFFRRLSTNVEEGDMLASHCLL